MHNIVQFKQFGNPSHQGRSMQQELRKQVRNAAQHFLGEQWNFRKTKRAGPDNLYAIFHLREDGSEKSCCPTRAVLWNLSIFGTV